MSEDQRRRQYRAIYELLFQNPRIYVKTISSRLKTDPAVASRRMKEAFDRGYIAGPHIRKRSYENMKEFVYFISCENSVKSFLSHIDDVKTSYHAVMSGFANLWIISREEINTTHNVVLEGPRSDFYMSFAPHHTWETAFRLMRNRVETFDPKQYEPQEIIKTRWDEHAEWDSKDEILFREFKYSLRKKLAPIMRNHKISGEKLYKWLGGLSEHCTVATSYFPEGFSAYDSYLFMLETDYEDFIIDLFSQLPTSTLFFKVSGKLLLYVHVSGRFVRFVDIHNSNVGQLQIPLLIQDLLDRGILKSEAHAILEYDWGKSL